MKLIERIKLILRAKKYKNKIDKGGIAFILSEIKNGDTVLDIGAHKAGYLYFIIQKTGKDGKVYAFEPQSALFDYIKKIKELFNWTNLAIEHLALSDSAGTVTLYIPTNRKSNSSSPGATIVRHDERDDLNATEEVTTETLDAYCKRRNIKPDFLKIDVEGNELRIFTGGIGVLQEYKPKILVEIEARHVGQEKVLETFRFLQDLGYKGCFIQGTNYIPLTEFSFDKHQNLHNMKDYCNNFIFD